MQGLQKIIIVGGGIGGMALAAALRRVGLSAVVLEQAPELGEVGAGLGVLPGAVRALRALGVSPELFAQAASLQQMRLANYRGRDMVKLDLTRLFEELGVRGYVMRRQALHRALSQCAEPSLLRCGARVREVKDAKDHAEVWLEGEEAPLLADLVVGADGLRSVVRAQLLRDGPPRYAGETILRGIADVATTPISRELFGPGRRFGYYDIGNAQTYYWATSPEPQGTLIPQEERRAYLLKHFSSWPFAVPELIERTPPESILQNDIFDRASVSLWHSGRVVLLGDAAHPTTPNMGQGACMAIEDAVALAGALKACATLEEALCAYERVRVARTRMITNVSRLWGYIGLWRAAPLQWLRDGFYRATPDAVFTRILQDQYSYDPGSL